MREWHVKHMQKTVVEFVTGLSANGTMWGKDRMNATVGQLMFADKQAMK